jgi:hypothetical protein
VIDVIARLRAGISEVNSAGNNFNSDYIHTFQKATIFSGEEVFLYMFTAALNSSTVNLAGPPVNASVPIW